MTRATITNEQFQAVAASGGRPVYLVDETGKDAALAIVRVDLLEAFAENSGFDIRDTYPAQEAALASIWDDPLLDEYTCQDGSPID
jgi:hypothetical protein